jgi:hypothetical protein
VASDLRAIPCYAERLCSFMLQFHLHVIAT